MLILVVVLEILRKNTSCNNSILRILMTVLGTCYVRKLVEFYFRPISIKLGSNSYCFFTFNLVRKTIKNNHHFLSAVFKGTLVTFPRYFTFRSAYLRKPLDCRHFYIYLGYKCRTSFKFRI